MATPLLDGIRKVAEKYYAEAGIGNPTFFNTEIEHQNGTEERHPGFIVKKPQSAYMRAWLGKKIYVLDSAEGLKIVPKDRKAFKLLFGINSMDDTK